jgi:hypothetical protein
MPNTHLSQSKSRRDLAASLRGSRTRKHARLRHRLLQAERLEDRRLLAGDFELSSLLPANGGDGSSGFVIDGITDFGQLGRPAFGCQPLGDINQDGVDDFLLAAPGTGGIQTTLAQVFIVFGRAEAEGDFPAELDLTSLDGTNGYVIDGAVPGDYAGNLGGGAGDINGDGVSDILLSQSLPTSRTAILFGGSENLAALDVADGYPADGHIGLSLLDSATDGTHGFVIDRNDARAAGDVNGDGVDDLVTRSVERSCSLAATPPRTISSPQSSR